MTPLEMAREFSLVMGQPVDHPPEEVLLALRLRLISEECREVEEAIGVLDDEIPEGVYLDTAQQDVAKELADLVYVIYGMAATFGIDIDEAVRRVHASNMSKLGDDGKPIYRADGKVTKSNNYQPPDMRGLW